MTGRVNNCSNNNKTLFFNDVVDHTVGKSF